MKASWFSSARLCALVWAFLPGTPASAQSSTIVQSSAFVQGAGRGAAFEVAGVRLGMLVDEVKLRAAQDDVQPPPNLDFGTLSLSRRDKTVRSQPYLKGIEMNIVGGGGRLRVAFGAPSIGSRVVALDYGRFYHDVASAPTVASVLDEFERKYGKNVREHLSPPHDRATRENWFFSANGPVPCGGGYCIAGVAADIDDIGRLRDSTTQGERVIVSVFVIAHKDDPNRAEAVSVEIEDVANELLGLTEAQKQLETALPMPPHPP